MNYWPKREPVVELVEDPELAKKFSWIGWMIMYVVPGNHPMPNVAHYFIMPSLEEALKEAEEHDPTFEEHGKNYTITIVEVDFYRDLNLL